MDDGIDGLGQNGYNEQVNDGVDSPSQNENMNKWMIGLYKMDTMNNVDDPDGLAQNGNDKHMDVETNGLTQNG